MTFTDTGNWHSLYYEYNKGTIIIDGTLYSLNLWCGNGNSSVMRVGGTGGDYQGFSGTIGNLRIYSRTLTQSEIDYNYRIDKSRFNLP